MARIIDFIKGFQLSTYGLDVWDMWMIFGIVIVGFILTSWLISLLPIAVASRLRKVSTFIFYLIFYGTMTFLLLNAYLTKDYGKLTVLIFVLILPYLRRWTETLYKKYDNFMDKVISKK